MYNNRQIGAENGGKEYPASNQVVGGSSPSGRAKVINDLAHFRKLELSHKNRHIKVVIGGWGAIVGSVENSLAVDCQSFVHTLTQKNQRILSS